MGEEINFKDPNIDQWFKDQITDMFNRFYQEHDPDLFNDPELAVCFICQGFYPEDRTKQEALAYVTIRASLDKKPIDNDILGFTEDQIMPLAVEYGVEDAFIQEILNLRRRRKIIDN
jgi:hypothetical protein